MNRIAAALMKMAVAGGDRLMPATLPGTATQQLDIPSNLSAPTRVSLKQFLDSVGNLNPADDQRLLANAKTENRHLLVGQSPLYTAISKLTPEARSQVQQVLGRLPGGPYQHGLGGVQDALTGYGMPLPAAPPRVGRLGHIARLGGTGALVGGVMGAAIPYVSQLARKAFGGDSPMELPSLGTMGWSAGLGAVLGGLGGGALSVKTQLPRVQVPEGMTAIPLMREKALSMDPRTWRSGQRRPDPAALSRFGFNAVNPQTHSLLSSLFTNEGKGKGGQRGQDRRKFRTTPSRRR